MGHIFERTELMIGAAAMEKLKNSTIAVIGIGGVGSYITEALVRSGVGGFVLIDSDKIESTNLNRQLHTNICNIGSSKVEVMKERILSINPDAQVFSHEVFLTEENMNLLWQHEPEYIADAIDSISSKLSLVVDAKKRNIPIISSMGTGNKMDPTAFKISDIYETKYCPLARVMRRELKKRGIECLKVVYSEEQNEFNYRDPVASISFCPSVAGLLIASEIIKDLIGYYHMEGMYHGSSGICNIGRR